MMLRAVLLTAVATAIFWINQNSGPAAFAQDRPELLIVHQDAKLHDGQSTDNDSSKVPNRIQSGTAVLGLNKDEFGEPARPVWRIATLENPPRYGWASASAVTPYAVRGKELKATAVALRTPRSDHPKTLPKLIEIAENPEIKRAYREVAEAVELNEKLPENERLPDPYFARAEIWAQRKHYSGALQDYLRGIHYARQADRDLLTYSAYFEKLQDVAAKLQRMPVAPLSVPPHPDKDQSFPANLAQDYYGRGCTLFFDGKYSAAVKRYEDAVQLSPDQPIYWYFRALTYRALGDLQRAEHDVLMGSYFERGLSRWRRRAISHALLKVQGEGRLWLEAHRLGSPNNTMLRMYKIDLGLTDRNR